MAKNIHFVADDEYDRLNRIKDEHGLTWRGMVKHAANDLETPSEE